MPGSGWIMSWLSVRVGEVQDPGNDQEGCVLRASWGIGSTSSLYMTRGFIWKSSWSGACVHVELFPKWLFFKGVHILPGQAFLIVNLSSLMKCKPVIRKNGKQIGNQSLYWEAICLSFSKHTESILSPRHFIKAKNVFCPK